MKNKLDGSKNNSYIVHELIMYRMGNQQLYTLTNEQIQVILTGIFSDGCLTTPEKTSCNSYYSTNCKFEEYLKFKKYYLGGLAFNIGRIEKNGYSQNPIYQMRTKRHEDITRIKNLSLEEALNLVDELGLAMWLYDDGSLHKSKFFYNINTHHFSKEIQETLFIPFFNKFGIYPKLTREVKKDGREFYYLRVSRYEGAYEITKILEKYPVKCYEYKVWSSETIQKWSKLQEELKSKDVSNFDKSILLRKI